MSYYSRKGGVKMCLILSFVPATLFLAIGYLVLVSSAKAEGARRRFGEILAIWVFIVALIIPIIGVLITLSGKCPLGN